jgi:hypothetical protein
VPIRVNTLSSYNGVEGFKCFRGEDNSWAKTANVLSEVEENMEFGFVEPTACPACRTQQKVLYFFVQKSLNHHQQYGPKRKIVKTNSQHVPRYLRFPVAIRVE